jgi:uncharacterized repeat protein (TIGR01451 family)
VTVKNNGPSDASGVVLTNILALPAGVALLSATPGAGAFDSGTGVWMLGNLANGASATLTLTTTVTAAATAGSNVIEVINVAAIHEALFNLSDDQASQTTIVNFAILSTPAATPSTVGVGQTVTFAVATAGIGLTFAWDFGDASQGTGASVTHSYNAPGMYTASVAITDATGANSHTFTVPVTVNAALVGTGDDSDGDGFSDSFENAVGTNPNDATSTPTGAPITAAAILPLTIAKASIKLNFAKTGKDSISFSGTLPVPRNFFPTVAKAYFYAGGVIKALSLTAKGSGMNGGDSIKVTLKSAKGAVLANPAAKYTATFKKGNFAASLAGLGLTKANASGATVSVPFTFIFNNIVYQKTQTMSYTAKKGISGSAK